MVRKCAFVVGTLLLTSWVVFDGLATSAEACGGCGGGCGGCRRRSCCSTCAPAPTCCSTCVSCCSTCYVAPTCSTCVAGYAVPGYYAYAVRTPVYAPVYAPTYAPAYAPTYAPGYATVPTVAPQPSRPTDAYGAPVATTRREAKALRISLRR